MNVHHKGLVIEIGLEVVTIIATALIGPSAAVVTKKMIFK